jgi:hypothetical protein
MTNSTEEFQRPWSMFLGWLFVGVLWMAGIGSILSIGLIILALAAVATWFMLRQPASRRGLPALISVGSLPFFVPARMNGPAQGTVLRSNGSGGVTGGSYSSPWPWVAAGSLFIVASAVVFLITSRRRA